MNALPRGTTDSHFHVFESPDRYPYYSSARYPPPLAPLEDYLALAREDGIERMVFVQPSAYGSDNRCMLDAMAKVDSAARGVVAIDGSTSEHELRDLKGRGVRGVRINVSPYQEYDAALVPRVAAEIVATAGRIAALGWHLDLLAPGWLITELLPTLRALPLDYSVAHLGLFPTARGVEQRGFREFLELIHSGRAWAKITGLYRISQRPDFDDVVPFVRAAIDANPDRVIWGSDWPHISFAGRVTNHRLLELLQTWVADELMLKKILVENPARLYAY